MTAIIQREAKMTDTMESMLIHAQTFEGSYGAHIIDVFITNIFEDLLSANYLAANYRVTSYAALESAR